MYAKSILILLTTAYIAGTLIPTGDALYFLGIIGRKTFFADTGTGRDWSAANKYCLSKNMALASIDSEEELAFLNKAYTHKALWHWLANTVSMAVNPVFRVTFPGGKSIIVNSTTLALPYNNYGCLLYFSGNNPRVEMNTCSIKCDTLCETLI